MVVRVSKAFVGDVLSWMEDAFALFTVKLLVASLSRQNANLSGNSCWKGKFHEFH